MDNSDNHVMPAIILTQYVIFSITPFIIYPIIACIYPRVSSYLKQYLQKMGKQDVNHDHDQQEAKLKIVEHWKSLYLRCLLGANLIMMSCLNPMLCVLATEMYDKLLVVELVVILNY